MQGSLELQPLPMNDPHSPVPALFLHLRPLQAAAGVPVHIFVKFQLPPPTLAASIFKVSLFQLVKTIIDAIKCAKHFKHCQTRNINILTRLVIRAGGGPGTFFSTHGNQLP